MIAIGQLAHSVGVTIKAIGHYQQCGLLDEPPREALGYRRRAPAIPTTPNTVT